MVLSGISVYSDYGDVAELPIAKEYTTCEQILHDYIAKGDFEKAAETANFVESTSPSEATDPAPEQTMPTAESAAASPADQDESIQTGTPTVVIILLVVILGGVIVILVVRKKKK